VLGSLPVVTEVNRFFVRPGLVIKVNASKDDIR
jgi:hypothetical protein